MTEMTDHELLAQYAQAGSEAAFEALVARHVNLVYSAAMRFTGNPHHAEEITQVVFLILARKAGHLGRSVVVSGWLYQTARLTAANVRKGEIRRQHREQEACMQSPSNEPAAWEQVAPLLEEAMGQLGEADRNAIVLRYFENKTALEIAALLHSTEAATHKRVNRALEKLRKFFGQRGVALTTIALAGTLGANSVQAAPVGLTATIAGAASAGTALSGSTLCLLKGVLNTMAFTKIKMAAAAGLMMLFVGGLGLGIRTLAIGAEAGHTGTTRMSITGPPGAQFTGFYQQDGKQTAFTNTVPWSFAAARISRFEIHKQSRADTLELSLNYDGEGVHTRIVNKLDPKLLWMQCRVKNGLITMSFPQ